MRGRFQCSSGLRGGGLRSEDEPPVSHAACRHDATGCRDNSTTLLLFAASITHIGAERIMYQHSPEEQRGGAEGAGLEQELVADCERELNISRALNLDNLSKIHSSLANTSHPLI